MDPPSDVIRNISKLHHRWMSRQKRPQLLNPSTLEPKQKERDTIGDLQKSSNKTKSAPDTSISTADSKPQVSETTQTHSGRDNNHVQLWLGIFLLDLAMSQQRALQNFDFIKLLLVSWKCDYTLIPL